MKGPRLFAAQMLTDQNYPVPDILDSRLAVTEVTSTGHNKTPPVLKMRGAAQTPALDNKQIQIWKDNGYLVIPDILSEESVADLLQCVQGSAEAIATDGALVRKQVFSGWTDACVNPNGRVIAALTERTF